MRIVEILGVIDGAGKMARPANLRLRNLCAAL